MDYQRPVETIIPGATGRLLAALARVDTALPVSTLAQIAGVGRTRASGIVGELSKLGLLHRREIGRTVIVTLARDNAAGALVDRLAHLRSEVIEQLRCLGAEIDPPPAALAIFGSFARGEADPDSDLDILAVRSMTGDAERWATSLWVFAEKAGRVSGNPVQVLEYDVDELRHKAGRQADVGMDFWSAVARDSVALAGVQLTTLLEEADDAEG